MIYEMLQLEVAKRDQREAAEISAAERAARFELLALEADLLRKHAARTVRGAFDMLKRDQESARHFYGFARAYLTV